MAQLQLDRVYQEAGMSRLFEPLPGKVPRPEARVGGNDDRPCQRLLFGGER